MVWGRDGEVFFLDLVGVSGVGLWGVGGEFFCEVEAGPGAPDSEVGVGLAHVHSGGEVLEVADGVA